MKYLILASLLLSGCSSHYKTAIKQYVEQNNLKERVTRVCYDYIDKKNCPNGSLQFDLDIVPYIFGTSRICLGTAESKYSKFPEGMICYEKDFIK